MAIPYAATIALVFFVPPELGTAAKVFIVALLYALCVSVFGTMMQVSRYAIIARMSLNPADRGTYSILGDGFFGVAATALMSVVMVLVAMFGWNGTFTIFAIVAFICAIITYFLCKELPREVIDGIEAKREKVATKGLLKSLFTNKYALLMLIYILIVNVACGFVQAGGTYYFTYVIGDMNAFTQAMVILLVFGIIAILLSKFFVAKSSRLLGYATLIAGILMILLRLVGGPENVLASTIIYAAMGVFTIQIAIMSFGQITAMVVDYGEWKSGVRADGVTSSVVNIGLKIGVAVGTGALGALMAAGGFIEGGGAQTAETVAVIENSFLVIPAVLMIICAVLFFITFRLPKQMPQIQADLAKRRQG